MAAVTAAKAGRRICASGELVEGGTGHRFSVRRRGEVLPAFAIRFQGKVHAYINRCTHQGVELDWGDGRFFDRQGTHLICTTHGARYHPATGACTGGRCAGIGLTVLAVEEGGGSVYLSAVDGLNLVKE